jgi:hypothetical protein
MKCILFPNVFLTEFSFSNAKHEVIKAVFHTIQMPWPLKMKVLLSFETSAATNPETQLSIPEDLNHPSLY